LAIGNRGLTLPDRNLINTTSHHQSKAPQQRPTDVQLASWGTTAVPADKYLGDRDRNGRN